MELCLILVVAFLAKHFVVDFLLQTPYMYLNKGTFLHPGGLAHSGLHAIVTVVILAGASWNLPAFYALKLCFALAALDFVLHYIVDLYKVKINNYYGWTAVNGDQFWALLGLDQFLHGLTYVLVIYLYLKGIAVL